jgi:hypothetical protein
MHVFKAAIGLALSTALVGAKPPPAPSGTADPQVGYVKILNNGSRELWVANEDGTGAVRLAATGVKSSMSFALGPKSQGLIAYTVPGQVHLLHFVQGSTGVKTDTDTAIVSDGSRHSGPPAISPTGGYIAWVSDVGGGGYGVHVYSLATHSVVNNITSALILSGVVDFSADGSRVIYSETFTPGDTLNVRFMSVPVTGGTPTELGIEGKYGNFRVGPADEIVADTMGDDKGSLWSFPSGATSPTLLTTNGFFPSPRCDSRFVIFARLESGGGSSVRKYELATGLTSTFSTAGDYAPDYFPDC